MIKISIILPCYNVERYISECLNSFVVQGLPENEYEIICVNDCTPDRTFDIVRSYQQKYNNVFIVEHDVNKRQGGARNTGLRIAKGEYIWFVDPDDTIKPGSLLELYQMCKVNDVDTLLFNFDKVDTHNKYISTSTFSSDSSIYKGVDYVKNVCGINFLNSYDGSIWNRIYKRTFLIEKNIFFPENMYWEDFDHSLKTILFADKIMSTKTSFYNYRINPGSVMNTLYNNNNMVALFDSTIRLGGMLVDFSNEVEVLDKEIADKIKEGGVWRLNHFIKPLIKTNWSNKKLFRQLLNKHSLLIKRDLLCFYQRAIVEFTLSLYILQIFTFVRNSK